MYIDRESPMWWLLWYGSVTVVRGDCNTVAFEDNYYMAVVLTYGDYTRTEQSSVPVDVYTCMGVFRPMGVYATPDLVFRGGVGPE